MENLNRIKQEQINNSNEEKKMLKENKEQNLSFINNENDDMENKILRLKNTIV